jgi:hypothetical protein
VRAWRRRSGVGRAGRVTTMMATTRRGARRTTVPVLALAAALAIAACASGGSGAAGATASRSCSRTRRRCPTSDAATGPRCSRRSVA